MYHARFINYVAIIVHYQSIKIIKVYINFDEKVSAHIGTLIKMITAWNPRIPLWS